jgi:hypothetical protein
MLLIDLTATIEADRERAFREALRRREARAAATAEPSVSTAHQTSARAFSSGDVAGVTIGDRAGRRGDPGPDVGGFQDLNPASGA